MSAIVVAVRFRAYCLDCKWKFESPKYDEADKRRRAHEHHGCKRRGSK